MLITPSFEKSLIVEQFQGNYLKARQDVKFYNQGKVQLGKTNISRDIAVQPYFLLYIPDPGLKLFEKYAILF